MQMAKPMTDADPSRTAKVTGEMRARVAFLARTGGFWRRLSAFKVAAVVSLVWVVGLSAYGIGFFGVFGAKLFEPRPAAALEIALFLLAAIVPVALFFYGALLARKAEEMRLAAARLTSAIDALRLTTAPRGGANAEDLAEALSNATRASMAAERDAMNEIMARIDAALSETQAMVSDLSQRDSQARRAAKTVAVSADEPDEAQPALPFVAEAEPPQTVSISWDSVVRALQFPKDENDDAGFAAIREVVGDHDLAALLQAAEDVLSLLSEDGLYMEDVQPQIAPLSLWQRYAAGTRGKDVADIGGVRDEVALAIARGRVRNDPVFRDTALHFLRRFDKLSERMLAELGDDPMILEVADSRTGRAFMVIARVMGVFD